MLRNLDPTVTVALFRIVQEAVNNAIRHGKAGRITVSLQRLENGLSIAVEDDGQGVAQLRAMTGHGIDNMKTRARLISARFEIGRNPDCGPDGGGGTRVRLTLPADNLLPKEA
jgi:signal transduction histidine kinase